MFYILIAGDPGQNSFVRYVLVLSDWSATTLNITMLDDISGHVVLMNVSAGLWLGSSQDSLSLSLFLLVSMENMYGLKTV